MSKTVLVTGANGFVGSHTLAALQGMADVRPIALVRAPRRLPTNFDGEVRQGDIRDQAFVERALDGVDAVCVGAAWTSAWGHAEESGKYLLQPTLTFLDTAVNKGIQRIVFPSSTTARVLRQLTDAPLRGKADSIWPHMTNVNRIEQHLQSLTARGTDMVVLRLGLFVGERYGLGMLPILLPRLRSHLVPWVGKGRTALPLIAGQDIGQAMALAATQDGLAGYTAMDVVGGEIPSVREVFRFLHQAYGYPLPHFGVSFPQAYAFARLMETVSRLTPWDPFITRSVVLLLEETAASNDAARRLLGYAPRVQWKDAIRAQLAEMQRDRIAGLRMARPIPAPLRKASA
jgi:nucleoside-diphosphate-sugar epimerase